MKKHILLLTIIPLLVITSIVVVTFDVPARINYSMKGMVTFSGENYTITNFPTDKECGILLNDSTLTSQNLTVFRAAGTDGIVNDSIVNYYTVYPEQAVTAAEMAKLDLTVIIDNISIKSFQKK